MKYINIIGKENRPGKVWLGLYVGGPWGVYFSFFFRRKIHRFATVNK